MSSTGASASTEPARDRAELALDVAFAVTWIGGAAHQAVRAWSTGEAGLGLAAALAPSLVAGVLVAARRPARGAGVREIAVSLPSLALPLTAPLWVPSPATWPMAQAAAFAAGALLTCWSLLSLGRSFAVLPARRPVVTRGPYRLVRHPVYAGELLMWGAACATLPWVAAALLFAAAVASLAIRVRAEERILVQDPAYLAYAARVRGRLLPAIGPGPGLLSGPLLIPPLSLVAGLVVSPSLTACGGGPPPADVPGVAGPAARAEPPPAAPTAPPPAGRGPDDASSVLPAGSLAPRAPALPESRRFSVETTLPGSVLFLIDGEDGRLGALVDDDGVVLPHRFERGTWQALPLPASFRAMPAASALGLYFGRDNRPRLMGHRKEGSTPRMVYLRYRDGRWQDQRSEVGSLASDGSVLFGVLGEADPEIVCKVDGICLRKSRRGWKELPNTLPRTAVVRAFAGKGYALTAEGLFVADDAGFRRVGPPAPWTTPASGFWVGDGEEVVVVEPAASALHHLEPGASAWRTEPSPVRGPRDVVGPAGDRWIGGDGGLAHEEDGHWVRVGPPELALTRVLTSPPGVVAAGPRGVVRVVVAPAAAAAAP